MIYGREAIYITVSLHGFPAGPKLCTQMLGCAPKGAPTDNALRSKVGTSLNTRRQVVNCCRERIGLETYSRGSDAVYSEPGLFSFWNSFISRSASAVLPCLR